MTGPEVGAPPGDPVPNGATPVRPIPLTDAERAAAFTSGLSPADRAAALRAGSTPVPRKVTMWMIIGFVVLGLGGVVGEHLLGNTGVGTPTTVPTTTIPNDAAPPTPVAPAAPPVQAPLDAFLGLQKLAGKPAPAVDLADQNGSPWTLADARGKVVVLTFFDAACTDICPIIGQELRQATSILGAKATSVQFVVVNTNPLQTVATPDPPALSQTALSNLSNVTFLNGTVSQLNRVWTHYGVTVTVQKTSGAVTHNDIMYFIDGAGRLRLRVTPFANEDQLGAYNLSSADISRFAQGIANSATSLMGSP